MAYQHNTKEMKVMTNTAQPMAPLVKLTNFFGVTLSQFKEFWQSCSEEEKAEFKAAIAKWDGKSGFID